jgi:hypothetical protein
MSIGNGETCRKNQEAIIGNELIFHVDLEVHHATLFSSLELQKEFSTKRFYKSHES